MLYHDIFQMYSAKAIEYALAVVFLFLFIPFWRYVTPQGEAEPVAAPSWLGHIVGWFHVPDHLFFHPGHAWARVGDGELVTVGADDFAHRLLGPGRFTLPPVGAHLAQGERAWSFASDGKSVDMLSPVAGTVVEVNERVRDGADAPGRDPYGAGWLVKVRAPKIAANAKQLLTGSLAYRWMEEACDGLGRLMSPELGQLYQDGGLPMDGMAHNLDADRWDAIARRFFLT